MLIQIKSSGSNIKSIMRGLGYYENINAKGQVNYIRPLASLDYPRFHIYSRQTAVGFELNLHMDAKKPTYGGFHAHNGEYEGEIVEKEAIRIKSILE